MIGHELIVIFVLDKGFICTDKALSFEQLHLPPIVKSFKSKAFWRFRVLNYLPAEKKIYAEILSYHVGDDFFSHHQLNLSSQLREIDTVVFKSIDTGNLFRTQQGTTPQNIAAPKPSLILHPEPPKFQPDPVSPISRKMEESFFVPIKEILFRNGKVSFSRKIGVYPKPIEISIANDEIIEEYDAIKNYFSNILHTKKIKVTVVLELLDGEILSVAASSPEISKITRKLIEDVKINYVTQTIGGRDITETTQTIFTIEEYFETFGEEDFDPKVFYGSEEEFMNDLLEISDTKHYHYLRYLSSKHLHTIMRLRFVHRPFSFVFLLESLQRYFFIWETLDTEEATYIWGFEKEGLNLPSILKETDSILNGIQLHGKKAYISQAGDNFKRINHDYTDISEGFSNWRDELNHHLSQSTR